MDKKSLSITFVLSSEGNHPGGGAKVVYEYANALVCRGHRVTVVHPAILGVNVMTLQFGRRVIRFIQRAIDGSYRPDAWFSVDTRVHLLWKPSLHARYIPDSDVIVATWWLTAEWVAGYPQSKGRKFYLVQSLETWGGPEARVMATWRLPMRKIVIARWLYEIAERLEEEATYIPNGLDFNAFGADIDPEKRDPNRVMMLYHSSDKKGSLDGIATLQRARESVPSLTADLFGVQPAPKDIPPWIHYHRNPFQSVLRSLYNHAAIFLGSSWIEGWPLPPAEAMMSGCALLVTDIGGHREYCIHNTTALLSPPKDPNAMAKNLVSLLQNQDRRVRLARSGTEYIRQFTWDRAANSLEAAFYVDIKT